MIKMQGGVFGAVGFVETFIEALPMTASNAPTRARRSKRSG